MVLRRSPVLLAVGLCALTSGCGKKDVVPTSTTPEPPVSKEAAPPKPELPKLTSEDAIRATVLIATKWGHGTGVFIKDDGWILTNHHVIAPGLNEDFGFEATVTIPTMNEDGSVAPGEKVTAVAYKVDSKRDLALLKIVDPKGAYPALRIAEGDPRPGRQVSAIGNAGVGFGWALKQCTINAIGTVESLASVIVQMDRTDISDDERKRAQDEVAKAVADLGKQIQTDCNVLPGDSGGPLVDRESNEIVGLNVAIRPAMAGFATLGSVALHVHVSEIRDFLQKVPDKPRGLAPDPWQMGVLGSFADANEDGEVDTLHFQGFCGDMMPCIATFSDLDQNSFRKGGKPMPSPEEARRERSFDAEMAVVHLGRPPRAGGGQLPVDDVMVYLDTNADRKFDKLLVKDGENLRVRGYKLDREGNSERDASLDNFMFANVPDLFKKKNVKKKAAMVSAALVGEDARIANPDQAHALQAVFGDSSRDGKLDTVRIHTRLDSRILLDVDQDDIHRAHDRLQARVDKAIAKKPEKESERSAMTERMVLRQIRRGKLHGDVLVVMGSPARVFYDTDKNGKYDLLLQGKSLDAAYAVEAFRLDGKGRTPAREHVGRSLLRPGLMEDEERVSGLEGRLKNVFPGVVTASSADDVTSFPSTEAGEDSTTVEFPGCDKKVFGVMDRSSTKLLMDLDGNAFDGKNKKRSADEVIKKGKFDPELAWVFGTGLSWVFYDRDNDGRYDLVLVEQGGTRVVGAAYTLDRSGKVSVDESFVGKPLFQPELFQKQSVRKSFDELRKSSCSRSW